MSNKVPLLHEYLNFQDVMHAARTISLDNKEIIRRTTQVFNHTPECHHEMHTLTVVDVSKTR